MNLEILIGPLVGGLIGYITNGIAIKMLFRPLRPIYIVGKRVPFTPGLIPKERDRIAASIGRIVGKELINQETLKETLLSGEMYAKLDRSISEWFKNKKESKCTVKEVLYHLAPQNKVDNGLALLKENISQMAYKKVVDLELGEVLAETACQEIKKNIGGFSMFLNDSLIGTARVKLENIINQMIAEQAEDFIKQIVYKEGDCLLDMGLDEIANKASDQLPEFKYILMKQYTDIIENQLSKILNMLDISQIVEDRIKGFDMLELEKLILEIMEKELKAIIGLGALLGAVMGVIMNIF